MTTTGWKSPGWSVSSPATRREGNKARAKAKRAAAQQDKQNTRGAPSMLDQLRTMTFGELVDQALAEPGGRR
jgi:hypothetical protein